MTLEQYAYLAEIIGVVIIAVSLIYVGIQVRQNTQSTKLATAQNLSRDLRDVISPVHRDSEFSKIYLHGMKDVASLTNEERYRVYVFIQTYLRTFENAYYQYKNGAVDEYVWEAFIANMKFSKGTSSQSNFWQERQQLYSEEFRNYYDKLQAMAPTVSVAPYSAAND